MAVPAPSPKKKPSTILRITIFWIVIVLGALLIYGLTGPRENLKEVAVSDVIKRANAGEITLLPSIKLQIGDRDNYGNYWDGGRWRDRVAPAARLGGVAGVGGQRRGFMGQIGL